MDIATGASVRYRRSPIRPRLAAPAGIPPPARHRGPAVDAFWAVDAAAVATNDAGMRTADKPRAGRRGHRQSPHRAALRLAIIGLTLAALASFRGKVLVISDAMTLCQESCPLDTANLVATGRAVTAARLGDRVRFATITIDPHRDTSARLAAYRDQFTPVPADWTLLTGSPDTLATLWQYLGVYYQTAPEPSPPANDWLTGNPLTYDISHADLIFFLDPDGHERFALDGPAHVSAGTPVPDALRGFLNDEGRRDLTQPDAATWTVPQALQVLSWLTNQHIHE